MSRYCQILGAVASTGNTVSHSHHKSKRTFQVNLQRKTYFVPSLQRNVTIRVSARGIKTIDKMGVDAAIQRSVKLGLIKL